MVKRTVRRRRHARRGGDGSDGVEPAPAAPPADSLAATKPAAEPAVESEGVGAKIGSFLSKINPFKKSDAAATAGRRHRKSRGGRRTRRRHSRNH